MAETLTSMYKDAGIPLEQPVTVIAQDPAYTNKDQKLLKSLLNIVVVPDPQAFLSITPSSLIMSRSPLLPVQAVVGDLGVSPAAIF